MPRSSAPMCRVSGTISNRVLVMTSMTASRVSQVALVNSVRRESRRASPGVQPPLVRRSAPRHVSALVLTACHAPPLSRSCAFRGWPRAWLGRRIEIARMRARAGAFDNVTWPGYVGMLTGSAPGRFAAAINQAPLFRRTRRPWLRPYDLAANALRTWGIRFVPPDHLLREVFETCRDYGEAKHRLETVPIARPAIFTLVGCTRGERCVIKRTEQEFSSRSEETAAANDWLCSTAPWEARVGATMLWTSSSAEAAACSRARREALAVWQEPLARENFAWVV